MRILIALCLTFPMFLNAYSVEAARSSYGQRQLDKARKAILVNKPSSAIKGLNKLLRRKHAAAEVDLDQLYLTLGRAHYQKRQFSKAIDNYSKIKMSSDFWALSIEESAWAFVAQGKEEKALAKLQTLMTPIFDQIITAEPYFLKALSHLRICDYVGIFKTTDHFKKRYALRIDKLQRLVEMKGNTPEVKALIMVAKSGTLQTATITKNLVAYPNLFQRDKYIQKYVRQIKKARSSIKLEKKLSRRLVYLAKMELKETEKHLNLLHVIEAEAIQRVHIAFEPDSKYRNQAKFSGSEWLKFPQTGQEMWVDEIDKFHVQVKDCPKPKGEKKWASK